MVITSDEVREIFKSLKNGNGDAFFAHVADDVDWTVTGAQPLAGHYRSKAGFIDGPFAKLSRSLPRSAQLQVEHLVVKDDLAVAVVEFHSPAKANNGIRFDDRYFWIVYFEDHVIVRVRTYLDWAVVAGFSESNPIA